MNYPASCLCRLEYYCGIHLVVFYDLSKCKTNSNERHQSFQQLRMIYKCEECPFCRLFSFNIVALNSFFIYEAPIYSFVIREKRLCCVFIVECILLRKKLLRYLSLTNYCNRIKAVVKLSNTHWEVHTCSVKKQFSCFFERKMYTTNRKWAWIICWRIIIIST